MNASFLILGFILVIISVFLMGSASARTTVLVFSVMSAVMSIASNYTNMKIARYRLKMDYRGGRRMHDADQTLEELIHDDPFDSVHDHMTVGDQPDFNLRDQFTPGPAQLESQQRAAQAISGNIEPVDRVTSAAAPVQYKDLRTRKSVDYAIRDDARLRNNRHRITTDSRMNANRNMGILFAEEFANQQSRDWWQREIDDQYEVVFEADD